LAAYLAAIQPGYVCFAEVAGNRRLGLGTGCVAERNRDQPR
jgi:hypothetical protein